MSAPTISPSANDAASDGSVDPPAYQNGSRRYSGITRDPRLPSHIPRQLHNEKKQKQGTQTSLPVEIIHIIASMSSPSTLAILSKLSKECYGIIIPYLYCSMPFTRSTAHSILWGIDLKENRYRFKYVSPSEAWVEPNENSRARKKKALSYVKEIRMDDVLVDVQLCENLILSAAEAEREVQPGHQTVTRPLGRGIEGGLVTTSSKSHKEQTHQDDKRKATGFLGLFKRSASISVPSKPGSSNQNVTDTNPLGEDPPPYDPLPQITSSPKCAPVDSTSAFALSSKANESSIPLCPNATRLIISPNTLKALSSWHKSREDFNPYTFERNRTITSKFHPIHKGLPYMLKPDILELNKSGIGQNISDSEYHDSPSFPYAIKISKHPIAVVKDLIDNLKPKKVIWHAILNEALPVLIGEQTEFEIHFTRLPNPDMDDAMIFRSRLHQLRTMLKDIHPPMIPARITIIGIGVQREDFHESKEISVQEELKERLLHPAAAVVINMPVFQAPLLQAPLLLAPPVPKAVLDRIEWVNTVEAKNQGFCQDCPCL